MEKDKKRDVSYNENNHVDVHNDFITAEYPDGIKAADMKMLRFVISQCRKGDKNFFEYEFNATDVAEHLHIDRHNLYKDATDMVEKRLFNCNLRITSAKSKNKRKLIHLFSECDYNDGTFTMQMDPKSAKLFLNLGENFTEIPIAPLLLMKNKNSIRIYEKMCEKFMSHYPYADTATSIDISVDELRQLTETADKKSYDHVGHLKDKILNPSIAEIEKAANWKIICTDIKKHRRITGFYLEVWSATGYAYIEQCKAEGKLPREADIPGQMSIYDYPEVSPNEK